MTRIEALIDDLKGQNQTVLDKETFVKLCEMYGLTPSIKIANMIFNQLNISVDFPIYNSRVTQIENKISQLLDKYTAAQKRYHGDSSLSKRIEEEIEILECELDLLHDNDSKAYKAAWSHMRKLAIKNKWMEYEIFEDSNRYKNGLLLIGYADKEHQNELGHVYIDVNTFVKTPKRN